MIGIRNFFVLAVDQTFTSDATLATITGLTLPISSGQTLHFRACLIVSVGATGGIRYQASTPTTSNFVEAIQLNNTITPAVTPAVRLTNTVFTNALASAGNHFLVVEGTITASADGSFSIQMAQNTSDVLTLTVQAGSSLETILV